MFEILPAVAFRLSSAVAAEYFRGVVVRIETDAQQMRLDV